MREFFRKFARNTSDLLGRAESFLAALLAIVIWAALGPVYHYSDTWQLVINTATTIVTFLMDPKHAKPGRQGDPAQAG